MNWRFCVDIPAQRLLDHCGKMNEGDGWGNGTSIFGEGCGDGYYDGYGNAAGNGWGGDNLFCDYTSAGSGDGLSREVWR